MCGIAGIVRTDLRDAVDEARLKRMRDVLRHRGPDDEGLWLDRGVGLGHRRLAIVDLATGHQPMLNERESVAVVYNGEIYNHGVLRSALEGRGHRYRTRSDTETILHAYAEDGDRCVERLQGMFAFALWDRERSRLLLARDRLGIKPLYYSASDEEILFASEIKAILAVHPARPAFNRAILPEYLANRFVAGEETFFRDIKKLLPGRTLAWSPARGLEERRYWSLPSPNTTAPHEMPRHEGVAAVREGLAAAVESHLMSDVPLGLFLSGGMDSSGLAALMAPLVTPPLRTFSVGFAEDNANELPYARLVASALGTEHHETVVSANEFFEALPRLVWHEDEPIAFPSSVPLYFVSRLARDKVKVVLTGEGADELFLGYNRYRVTAWNERLGRPYRALAPTPLRTGVRRLVRRLPRRMGRYVSRTFLALEPTPRDLFFENFAVFPVAAQGALLMDRTIARDPYEELLHRWDEGEGDWLLRMSRTDLQTYLLELLMKQDQMSMAASVESRVPFLDHVFVERVLAMPSRLKLRGLTTKAVLRDALRGRIPPAVLSRRKMGFPVPIGAWLGGRFWPVVSEFVLGERALARSLFHPAALAALAQEHRAHGGHGDRLWLLVNLEIWQRVFLDGDDMGTFTQTMRDLCESSG